MSRTGSEPCHDPLKASKLFAFPEKPSDLFVLLMRLGLIVCLVASITLALHSAFSTRTRWFSFPDHLSRNVSDRKFGPTKISHLLFGLAGTVRTWRNRSRYGELWWDTNTTRGFVWLDEKPAENASRQGVVSVPYRVSEDWSRFKYLSSQSAVRIARIFLESYKLGLPNVRWFVMGDDDTVFFTDNLVSVLASYDHNQMYYIGGNSESVEQDTLHSYDMAFGGGGFAISYPLAAQLVKVFDGCLDRYYTFYGSDQRVWACVSELGVPLTKQRGFHQFDIRGDPFGILSAHPLAPLLSLHHLDNLKPMFPNQTRIESVESLVRAYRIDPRRILQQSFCYHHGRKWSVTIAWGYTIQIYASLLPAKDLQTPLLTFKTWRSWSDGPFTFNTRPMSSVPCGQPITFFLDKVQEVGRSGTLTTYKRFVPTNGNSCGTADYARAMAVQSIKVTSLKMDPEHWRKAPRRQCCEIMDRGTVKDSSLRIRIRKCRPWETITI
ncbi:uncharacterized protein LOC122291346 [Carya illinoinensis]|uniref:Uncharacterized protein n=1 Tax=Carya illinoinensis TaxID=32201 RepID=A0A8T1RTS1_CARIL|nr:uncharacterized protein LOC122291346 [Carya illinoinensis]KAG6670146.1 hypothetical protein CIPAW_01G291100 [Carya illinoinensis]